MSPPHLQWVGHLAEYQPLLLVVLADFWDPLTSNLPLLQNIQCVQACKKPLLAPQANYKTSTTFLPPTTQILGNNKPTFFPSTWGCQAVDTQVITCLFCYSSCMVLPEKGTSVRNQW